MGPRSCHGRAGATTTSVPACPARKGVLAGPVPPDGRVLSSPCAATGASPAAEGVTRRRRTPSTFSASTATGRPTGRPTGGGALTACGPRRGGPVVGEGASAPVSPVRQASPTPVSGRVPASTAGPTEVSPSRIAGTRPKTRRASSSSGGRATTGRGAGGPGHANALPGVSRAAAFVPSPPATRRHCPTIAICIPEDCFFDDVPVSARRQPSLRQ